MIAVIKTFMRPKCAERCIASVRANLPGVGIVVVDDSPEPYLYDCDTLVELPYDSGLAAGRNAGVRAACDELVLILDDDHEIPPDHGIPSSLPDWVDILCGMFDEGGYHRHYEFTFRFEGDVLYLDEAGPGPVDVGHNFMLARSSVFSEVLWEPEFKVEAEHLDFFLNAYLHGLSVVYDPSMKVLHHPEHSDGDYHAHRFRSCYWGELCRKWGLSEIHDSEGRVWTCDS